MIVKARAGTGGPALARYLESGKNDRAELLELRNMDAPSLNAALYRMDALAKGSRADKPALHVQMRAAPGERLSAEHWREAVDRYAEEFGLREHQAAIVLHHQPDGGTHCHAVFNRVHPETLKAVHLSQNYARHQKLARQMEQDWGLRQVSSQKRERKRNYSDRGRGETEQAKRAGQDVHAIRERIRAAWEQAENGHAFAQALEADGFTLAQGERRDFVAVDSHGHPYSLGSRTTGAKAREVRDKLQDLDPATVPTLEAARQRQHDRAAQQAHEQAQRETLARLFGRRAQPAPERPEERPQQAPSPYRMEEAQGPTVGLWRADRGREERPAAPTPAQDWNQTAQQRRRQEAEERQARIDAELKARHQQREQDRGFDDERGLGLSLGDEFTRPREPQP